MCTKVKECLQNDPEFVQWVRNTIRDDYKSSILTKTASILLIVLSKYNEELIELVRGLFL